MLPKIMALVFATLTLAAVTVGFSDGFSSEKTVLIGNSSANATVVIGYLMDQLGPPYRLGALSMAIQDGQSRGLLTAYNFRYVKFDNNYY